MTPRTHARPIVIAPVGQIERRLVASAAQDSRAILGRDVVVGDGVPLPSHAFSRQRDQWRAAVILDALADAKRADWLRLLGIADVDLYAPDLNFVFGEADERRGVAVFSTARLRLAAARTDRVRRRAATQPIHQPGDTSELEHRSRT